MARLTIDTGTAGNTATGDSIRSAFTKVNANFTEIYDELGSSGILSDLSFAGNTISTDGTNQNLILDPNGTGKVIVEGTIELGGLSFDSQTITGLTTNSNIKLAPAGTGSIDVDTSRIINVTDPTSAQDAATKNYVDTQLSSSSHNITFVGDDSTGTAVTQGETFKFAGTQNITTAVSGDTLTITGPDLSSYATTAYVDAQNTAQALTFVGDDSTGTAVNSGETFKIAGATGITTSVSGDTLTVTGTAQDFAFGSLTGTPTTIAGYGITDAVAAGSTAVTVVGDDSTGTAVNIGETFKIAGTQNVTTAVSGDTLTITGPNLSSYLTSETSHADVVVDGDFASQGIMLRGASAGTYSILTDNSSNWNTAYSWGNHASAGYLTNSTVTLVGDDSTGATLNTGETFKIAGTQNVTTAVSGDTLTITGPDLTSYLTAISVTTDSANLDEPIVFVPSSGNKSSVRIDSDNKLTYNPSTNTITLNSETITSTKIGQWNTAYGWGDHASAGYLTGTGTQTIDNLSFNDNIISTSSNADLNLNPGGTGQVVANSALKINKGYIEAINALTSSSTITVDFSTASVHTVTLAENTQFVVTNLPTGGTGTIIITQDGGGTNTGTFGTDGSTAVKFAGGTPTLSTAGGAIDVVTIFNDGVNYLGNIAKAYA